MNPYNDALLDYLTNSTPSDWHQVAWNWNWDNSIESLKWIVENPGTDKGTALLLYWYGGPRFFSQYTDEIQVSQYQLEHYKLLKDIEKKFISGFYKNENIAFDPKNDDGHDWTKEYGDVEMKVKIPEEMYQPTAGEKLTKVSLEDGYPDEVLKKIED